MNRTASERENSSDRPKPLRLGFARGVAPAKWERRWRAASQQPLELVPLDLAFGDASIPGVQSEASDAAEFTASCDMVIMRTAPGDAPAGTRTDEGPPRHALQLYTEAIALVVAAGHELADGPSVSLADLELVTLLDHPDHASAWPAAAPWVDPSWMPAGPRAALDLVATNTGGVLLPLPLARHLTTKREHAVLPIRPELDAGDAGAEATPALPGSVVWAVWLRSRDAADVQQLAGILRGRTARSSRDARANPGADAAPAQPRSASGGTAPQRAKSTPKLKPNSRGAQLAAAKAKAERKRAESRAAKKRKRR